jgi:hypothetical protein
MAYTFGTFLQKKITRFKLFKNNSQSQRVTAIHEFGEYNFTEL